MTFSESLTAGDPPRRARFADRYDLIRLLKQGNGVATYLATDAIDDATVVVKVFDADSVRPGMRARFIHETRVLSELSGLGLLALHDAGQTGDGTLYLAQDYVPGRTLEQVLAGGPLPLIPALQVGVAVAAALESAHAMGICHRDVKPANIILDVGATSDVRPTVTLIDFGFARSPWLDEAIRDEVVGTVRYLSPEAAGALSMPVDERSDLYALGVVLYECLTGRPPFDAATVGDLLRQHLSAPVPDLTSAAHFMPRGVVAVVNRLLRKDPADRYQSAAAVRSDLTELLAATERGALDPPLVVGRYDRRRTLTDPAFVGRDAEVDALAAFASSLSNENTTGIVLLEADSGGGKSRLLSEVARRARQSGLAVVHGQGIAFGGQRPFTLLHGVADDLVALYADDLIGSTMLRSTLADVAPAIVRALPTLAALLGQVSEEAGPEQFGELRSLAGLRRLLAGVASAGRPMLVVLDDCQWTDALTVRLLADLFAGDDQPRHLGVIAAFRSEEVPADDPLRAISGARRVRLDPLSPRAVGLLAESMAGPLPHEAVETVVRLADGNPFMAAAVLHGLVESEAITPAPSGWAVEPARLTDVQAARRSATFLVRRLELLGPTALELLSVGAVLGKQFEIGMAVQIAGSALEALDGAADVMAILEDARRRRLLWLDDGGDSCTFFHDKIRESLLLRLPEDVRRALHGRAADALLERGDDQRQDSQFDLAYHLHEAGRSRDALPYALAAAELARSRHSLDVAASHYRMAEQGAEPGDEDTLRRIAEGLGDVYTLQGSYAAAREELTAARRLARAPADAAALDGKLGALAFKQGDIPTAKTHLVGALRQLGRRVPSGVLLVLALLWELLVQAVHTIAPKLTTGRRSPEGHDDDFLAMRLYSPLAYLYWFSSGKVACAWSHLRGMNLAERYPPSTELGQAWSEHAPVMTMLPWYGRGIRYAQRSLAVRRELHDVWGEGQSLNFNGVVRYSASQFDEALLSLDEAVRLLRRTGDQWEVNTGNWNRALCLWRQGRLRECIQVATSTFDTARAIGDQTAAGIALSIWARATDGRVPAQLVREMLAAGSEDAQTTAELHLADGLARRAAGDLSGAVACLERAVGTVKHAGLRQEYVAPVFAYYATMLREQAEQTSAHDPGLRAARLRKAARAARTAVRWGRAYRNNLPHAWRESALVASMRGRRTTALRRLHRSEQAAERLGATYESAMTRLAVAVVSRAPDAQVAEAHAALAALDPLQQHDAAAVDRPNAVSLLDRFATLLHAGRTIAAASTERGLESAIRDAALGLLRAEHCHLIPAAALFDDRLTTQSGTDVDGLSRTLLLEAVETGRPVVALGESVGSTDSLVLSGIRCALAAPILVNGEPRLCLYVTHRQLGELFGDDEIQLAAFIATLAGAGYEHLQGSENRFRALVQSSSDVITMTDADGVVGYQSPAVERLFGGKPAALLGQPVWTWVHADDQVLVENAIRTVAVRPGATERVECRLRHADGSYHDVESVVSNLLDDAAVGALVFNTRDITDRRLAADQLRIAEERERIARDLHDVVIQRLFALGLNLDSLASRLPDSIAPNLEHATDELHRTIRDIRGAIFTLRDENGDALHERIAGIVDRAGDSLGFRPDATIDLAINDVPAVIQWHLLATVNEALSNVVRHSGATAVSVAVTVNGGRLTAAVTDNGRGLPASVHESGLANLRRRAATVGGAMSTEAGPDGRGLALTWQVPVGGS